MYTIDKNVTNEIIIKNSRFICSLYKINCLEDVNYYLEDIRTIYKDATHYCYAYICNELKKSSDDGEPGGTAGSPILQVLEKNKLNFVLCIVTRYFGGIKLGAGGLVRAYSKSVTEALKEINLISLIDGYEVKIEFSYYMIKEIDYLLRNSKIILKEFNDKVMYKIHISKDILDKLYLLNDISIEILNNLYICDLSN